MRCLANANRVPLFGAAIRLHQTPTLRFRALFNTHAHPAHSSQPAVRNAAILRRVVAFLPQYRAYDSREYNQDPAIEFASRAA